MEEIGRKIANLRKQKGLTQKELADELYISNKTISKWETGEIIPNIEMLISLADFFEISLDELINDKQIENRIINNPIIYIIICVCCVLQFLCFMFLLKSISNLFIIIFALIGIVLTIVNFIICLTKIKVYRNNILNLYIIILNFVSFVLIFIVSLQL